MKTTLYIFIILYILFAIVQFNDPDSHIWILAYMIPAYLCHYKMLGRGDNRMFFFAGLIYLLWSLNQFPPQWKGLMIENLRMKTLNVELGRESLGLAFCTLGLWFCAFLK